VLLFAFPPGYPLTCLTLEGATVRVIEEDDGSGWVKVLDEGGGRGLVPASYVESADASRAPESGAGRPIGSGSGQFGK
jgi:formin-binding protein 1